MLAQLQIKLLGQFLISQDGLVIHQFESNKVRALLAYLVVENHQPHSRGKLAALFWPEMGAKNARSNLSRALYNLRMQLPDQNSHSPYLLCSRDAIQFNPESDYWLDVESFRGMFGAARRNPRAVAKYDKNEIADIQAGLEIYQGDFLDDLTFDSSFAFDEWVLTHRHQLQRQFLQGLYLLAKSFAERGELTAAISWARRQVETDPIDERACRQLMRLLAANHQRNQALKHCEHFQVMLAEELNIAPEPQTLALRDQIRGHVARQAAVRGAVNNLPAFLTPMIGRDKEMAELHSLLRQRNCRLLTMLGPGGIGKTRLALEFAKSCAANFPQGVFFVPLNPVQSPESILPAIARVLDLPRGGQEDIQVQLTNYLRRKNILLILDGLEHLLEGIQLLAELLHHSFGLKILATSRAKLNVKGEFCYLLSGMCFPDHHARKDEILNSDAIQLLVSGLQRARLDYQPGIDDIQSLQQICEKVQGMPLGILLAASWGGSLSVAEINSEINRGLDFLAADWVDVPTRQRSLRATFDHTWMLLGNREQAIFRNLSVFRGSFTRRAAQVVSGASAQELRILVERSLLLSKTPGWFEIHELLRQYGRRKLAEMEEVEGDVCARHSTYYLEQLARLGDELKSAGQPAAMSSIDLEHENYRVAWNWCAKQGETKGLARALDALPLYYDLGARYPDGESACLIAIQGLHDDPADGELQIIQARLRTWQSRFTRLLGRSEAASYLVKDALAHLEAAKTAGAQIREVDAFIHLEQGNILFNKDREAATHCYQRSLQIYRSLEDHWGQAKALARLGLTAHHVCSFKDAFQRYSEALDLYRSVGDPGGIANALVELGHNTLRQGQVSSGQQYIREGIEILQQIGDRAGFARGCFDLGRSHFWTGQFAQGNKLMAQADPIFEDLGMRDRLVFSIIGAGLGLTHLGRYDDAISQANKGLPMARDLSAFREIAMGYLVLGHAHLGQGDLEETQNWALKAIAGYQEIGQRGDMAWAIALMAFVQRALGHPGSATPFLHQTLEIGIETNGYFPVLCGLYGLALLLIDQGEMERAVEFAALVLQFPVAANSHWFEDVAGREITIASESLSADVVAAARERGQKRDIWETASMVLAEISP